MTTNENTNRNSSGSDATTDASQSQPLQQTQQQSPSNLTYSLITRKIATGKTTNDHSQNIDEVLGKRGDADSVTSGSWISGSTVGHCRKSLTQLADSSFSSHSSIFGTTTNSTSNESAIARSRKIYKRIVYLDDVNRYRNEQLAAIKRRSELTSAVGERSRHLLSSRNSFYSASMSSGLSGASTNANWNGVAGGSRGLDAGYSTDLSVIDGYALTHFKIHHNWISLDARKSSASASRNMSSLTNGDVGSGGGVSVSRREAADSMLPHRLRVRQPRRLTLREPSNVSFASIDAERDGDNNNNNNTKQHQRAVKESKSSLSKTTTIISDNITANRSNTSSTSTSRSEDRGSKADVKSERKSRTSMMTTTTATATTSTTTTTTTTTDGDESKHDMPKLVIWLV